MKRPSHVVPPRHLSPSPPVPEPREAGDKRGHEAEGRADPVRYGDWELNGIAVDF